ncbi:DNA/RNA non-specific endonuclease [Flaviaesturariibacter amylovorans]|uniref:DNA/RNA non-specific endonuclease n=1 Tax=Flaviaesturariibacter amylovorans TaxID=1084520 RepID=A0ABP8GIP3_9BACT
MNNKLTLAGAVLLLTITACDKKKTITDEPVPAPVALADNHPLLLGNPTDARRSAQFSENYLMEEPTYAIAYSASRGIPVWAAWHLSSEEQGPVNRQDDFRENPNLPASWYDVRPADYSSTTFDRGHNVPSEDRTASIAANSSTFLMTNMIPQAPQFNQGPWANMETYIRSQIGTTTEAYIYMGNYGVGGVGTNGVVSNAISSGNVTVPKNVYKIVVFMPKGGDDANRIDTSARVLAVDMPNDNRLYPTGSSATAWQSYKVPIDSIEARLARAGRPHTFLGAVHADVRNYLRMKPSR